MDKCINYFVVLFYVFKIFIKNNFLNFNLTFLFFFQLFFILLLFYFIKNYLIIIIIIFINNNLNF